MYPRAILVAALSLLASACGSAPRPEAPPPPPPKVQFVEAEAPFIVDWDAAQIAGLTTSVRGGNIGALVVASRGGLLRLLPECALSGIYVPSGIGMYRGMLQVRPSGARDRADGVRPDALQQLATSENVTGDALVDYRIVVTGRLDVSASRRSARHWDLTERAPGGCRGATHFVRAALTGAFERVLVNSLSPPGGPAAPPGGPGPHRMPERGGDFAACLTSGTAASPACSAFLKIELSPIAPVRVQLRIVSLKLGGKPVSGYQLVFRGRNDYRAGTTPLAGGAAAADWVLPVAEITEDVPLIVDVLQPGEAKPKVLATGEITPSDVRKAVFEIDLSSGAAGKVGAVQLAASEVQASPSTTTSSGSSPPPDAAGR